MSAHSMAAFNKDQFDQLVALGLSLGNAVAQKLDETHATFKRVLVDTDTIFVEDDQYKQASSEIVKTVGNIMEVSDIQGTISTFQKGAEQIAEAIGVTMQKNQQNLEEALAGFQATVKKAGEEVGQ